MRGKGITYDTGFLSAGTSTHEPFDPEVVRREMRVIRDDLHCNAVRVTGGDAHRRKIAATYAADGQSGSGVRRYPDLLWEPKAAFTALANHYGGQR